LVQKVTRIFRRIRNPKLFPKPWLDWVTIALTDLQKSDRNLIPINLAFNDEVARLKLKRHFHPDVLNLSQK
jgi:hypothetical protein